MSDVKIDLKDKEQARQFANIVFYFVKNGISEDMFRAQLDAESFVNDTCGGCVETAHSVVFNYPSKSVLDNFRREIS